MRTKSVALIGNIVILLLLASCRNNSEMKAPADYPLQPISFEKVKLTDNFWAPKIEKTISVTIPEAFAICEQKGHLKNFLIAGGKMEGAFATKNPFDDTDIYKIIEGASYGLSVFPDIEREAYLDSLIAIIAVGQEVDGYLTTSITIDSTYSPVRYCPPGGRWKNLRCSHELYNSGHLFEAAVAHYNATGKTNLLDIAVKNADLLVREFGNENRLAVPGHQIVETGLVKLFRITSRREYLDLARQFLDLRGDSLKRSILGEYWQDHKPVVEQDEAVGHAVRAMYMYAGMTDIAACYNDLNYLKATENLWENVVSKKLYLTGGIGSRHRRESFGENYELPNLIAYNETCAAIGNVYWNYKMFLLSEDSKYLDVLERSLYNGVISGIGLDGKTFFYPNPLECDLEFNFNKGKVVRQPWFDTSCCPTNLCRFIPSVPGYVYAQSGQSIYLNLFMSSETTVDVGKNKSINVKQETGYPWDGNVNVTITPQKPARFALRLRIPGWAQNKPVPGNLYSYLENVDSSVLLKINGESYSYGMEKGFAVIERTWNPGDVVELLLPVNIQRVICNENVTENIGKVALERGPFVFCFEGADNGADLENIFLSDKTVFHEEFQPQLLGGILTLRGYNKINGADDSLVALPYYAWCNRGANKMKVWVDRE